MDTREELHQIVDWLPDDMQEAGRQVFLDFLKETDPVLYALITAPEDDEAGSGGRRVSINR